jgi:hypothetical protein
MAKAILRTAKLTTLGEIAGSAGHTLRTLPTPNADAKRTPLNYNSIKSVEGICQGVRERVEKIKEAGHRITKSSVQAIEYLLTASPDFFTNDKKTKEFFSSCKHFVEELHGKDNVVSFHVQFDETTPHAVAYVVPKTKDGRLSAKEFLGGRAKLSELQDAFADRVAKYGLERGLKGSKAKHEAIRDYYTRVNTPTPDLGFFDAKASLKAQNAKLLEAKAKAKKMEQERKAMAQKNQSLEKQVERFREDEKLTRLACARLIKNAFSKSDLAKMFDVEIIGKQDIFDALVKQGQANNFAHAVGIVSAKIKTQKADWDETVKFAVELEDNTEPNLAPAPSVKPRLKI